MNTQICKALMTLGLSGALAGVALHAQDRPREVGTIPFAFQAGTRTLPAGTYAATELNINGVILLTNQATRESIMVGAFASDTGEAGQSKLTFNCYHGRCFLTEIWYPQETVGHRVRTSRLEKEMAANAEGKKVYVAMR